MDNKISRNKQTYKLFLTILKYTPISMACLQIILLTFNYNGIYVPLVTYLGGTSGLFLLLLFMMSKIFNFCYLYKIPLWYNTLIIILGCCRQMELIPIEILDMYRVYGIISGIFMIIFIYYMYKNRNQPKVDYIKDLCIRYGCCK